MASRRSLTFGGGLSVRKRGKGGQDSPESDGENGGSRSVDVSSENDGSLRGSVDIQSSPERAHLPTVTPNGVNRKKGRKDHPVGTPKTMPVAEKTAHRRQLAEVLANQQQILKRMAKLESMMEDLQKTKQRTGAREKQTKLEVSNDVRSMVRQGYEHAITTGGKEKWNLTKGMKATAAVNSETTQAVHDYVQGLLPEYANKIHIIKAAVDTYFASKARGEKREADGKAAKHKKNCKRNTRKSQKLIRRRKALRAKQSYNTKLKEQLQRVLVAEYMSSDESDTDDNGERVLKTKAIPWESDEFAKYKHELDMKFSKLQTEQAKRQSMKRIPGPPSTTNVKIPLLSEQDAWIAK